MSSLERDKAGHLMTLLAELDAGRSLRLSDIERACKVKSAQASKYIKALRNARPTLQERREDRVKVWYLLSERPATREQQQEVAALEFACQALKALEGTPHYEHLKRLAEQARNALGDVTSLADRMSNNFHVRPVEESRRPNYQQNLRILMQAVEERRRCEMRYETLHGVEGAYEIDPWAWLFHRDELFLLAGKREAGGRSTLRTFSTDGVIEATFLGNERFPPRPLNLEALFRDSIGAYSGPATSLSTSISGSVEDMPSTCGAGPSTRRSTSCRQRMDGMTFAYESLRVPNLWPSSSRCCQTYVCSLPRHWQPSLGVISEDGLSRSILEGSISTSLLLQELA